MRFGLCLNIENCCSSNSLDMFKESITPDEIQKLDYVSFPGKIYVIESVGADANAPVEYYNLQGVKVANPDKGLYIKKQGKKVTKVIL